MSFVELAGVTLCYEEHGEGPPLLAINGSGSDLRNRPGLADSPLPKHFATALYDHRGLGRSEPTDLAAQPTMADFGADALALADHLGWGAFSVIGFSFGGMVAQELAIAAGDRIERLVLGCTSSGGAGAPSYPLHDLYALPFEERIETHARVNDTRCNDDPTLLAGTLDFLRQAGDAPPAEGFRRQLEARRHHDTYDRLDRITAPTLVCAGRFDGIAPVPNAEAIVARIPDATLAVFEGGHPFMIQDRAAFPAMIAFLQAAAA